MHARSPWKGVFYERLLGMVKTCFVKALYHRSLFYDTNIKLLKEVMSIVGNRPLTHRRNSTKLLTPLTPNHLIKAGTVDLISSLEEDLDNDPRLGNKR